MEDNFKHTPGDSDKPSDDKPSKRPLEVIPYSIKQLSKLYGVHRSTFYRWIGPHKKAIGKKNGHNYTIYQVETIFSRLGLP